MKKSKMTTQSWKVLADRELKQLLGRASRIAALKRLGSKSQWTAEVSLCGTSKMTQLNHLYRKKKQPTDVLSFEAPQVFKKTGHLGELVICLPVLKLQARELGHSDKTELRVLLAHGILHLLGLDHEKSVKESRKMSLFESKLLKSPKGLIHRAR